MSLVWKINRLKAMGLPETVFRLKREAKTRLEALGFGLAKDLIEEQVKTSNPWQDYLPVQFDHSSYITAADKVLAGCFQVFSLDQVQLGFPPDWNTEPRTCTKGDMGFGKRIDYRDSEKVGDIKYLWEFNRHLELTTLAQAWHLTGEAKYAFGVRKLLESWFDQCSYPSGLNWTSSLEQAIRITNWSFTWHLLGGDNAIIFANDSGAAFRRRWLNSIYQHCFFINGYLSLYSSGNNHLFGEYMGLFIGSVTWPNSEYSTEWQQTAKKGLEEEALKQSYSDGVNKEQAMWYHHSVLETMLLSALVGRANGNDFSSEYLKQLEAMLEYIASIMDFGDNIPMFGDSDDAVMVRFSQEKNFNVYRSLLATGSILFNRSDFKVKAGRLDDKTRWLLGDKADEQFYEIPDETRKLPVRYSFPEGGYSILGHNFESPKEVRIIADAGQLGYLSIAAHGHADALSFTLSVGGNEVLIDPGTYAYHTQKKWRDYFRGTSAHNTVTVDGQDQSVSGGNFLWLKRAKAKCLEFNRSDERDFWVGEHDGYCRLKDRVNHKRQLTFEKSSSLVTVVDSLTCKDMHDIDLHWHFAETCIIDIKGSRIQIRTNKVMVTMSMPDIDWQPQAIAGQEDPPLGWISRRFDEKQPITTIRWSGAITGSTELTTIIKIEFIEGQYSSEN